MTDAKLESSGRHLSDVILIIFQLFQEPGGGLVEANIHTVALLSDGNGVQPQKQQEISLEKNSGKSYTSGEEQYRKEWASRRGLYAGLIADQLRGNVTVQRDNTT